MTNNIIIIKYNNSFVFPKYGSQFIYQEKIILLQSSKHSKHNILDFDRKQRTIFNKFNKHSF